MHLCAGLVQRIKEPGCLNNLRFLTERFVLFFWSIIGRCFCLLGSLLFWFNRYSVKCASVFICVSCLLLLVKEKN